MEHLTFTYEELESDIITDHIIESNISHIYDINYNKYPVSEGFNPVYISDDSYVISSFGYSFKDKTAGVTMKVTLLRDNHRIYPITGLKKPTSIIVKLSQTLKL